MDLKAIKNRLTEMNAPKGEKKEKIDYSTIYWKPKAAGKYQIRILNSKWDEKMPFKEVLVHYGFAKFPIFALSNWGEKDPIVEFVKQLKKSNDKEDWTMAGKIYPKTRIFAPVIVRGEEEKGVRLWEFGKEIYNQLLGIADDEDYGDYTDVNEGRDFTIDAVVGEVGGRQGIKCSLRIKPKTTKLSEDAEQIKTWLENQPNILEVQKKYDFDTLKEILQNWLSPDPESEDKEEVVTPPSSVVDEPTKKSNSKSNKFEKLFEEDEK